MKIYFTVAHKNFAANADNYMVIRQSILGTGNSIVNDWIPEYKQQVDEGRYIKDSSRFYQAAMKNIELADITIFDATVSSMSIGHQMTYSLFRQKPTLLLLNKAVRKKNDLFIAGSHSPTLDIMQYGDHSYISNTINKFILENHKQKGSRLNLALDKKQNDYLAWAAFTNSTTKTEIAKQAIDKLSNSDEGYQGMINTQI